MASDEQTPDIWKSFMTAVGAEYREHKQIVGQSGLTHAVQAIGVDDKNRRVIIASAEHNPRIAALMRIDIQATLPSARVLVARPIAIDLAHTARVLFHTPDGDLDIMRVIQFGQLMAGGEAGSKQITEEYGPMIKPLADSVARSGLPIRSHLLNAFEQIAGLNWKQITGTDEQPLPQRAFTFLDNLRHVDNLAGDRAQGICAIPTYQLTDSDWDTFQSGKNLDEVEGRLKALGIHQYFYPPIDTLALGMIDGGFDSPEKIAQGLELAKADGHLLAGNELISDLAALPEILEALSDGGYVMKGKFESELTPAGKSFRQNVEIQPREGLISKLSQRISLSFSGSLADLLRMTGN